jgi:uncharacterized protein (TIGR02996 family)
MKTFCPRDFDVTDGNALLRAILANPADEVLRLVYADWLDEAGDFDRASFIRIQMEAARVPSAGLTPAEERLLGSAEGAGNPRQRRREWALPPALRNEWPAEVGGWEWRRGFAEIWHCPLAVWEALGPAVAAATPLRRVELSDCEPQGGRTNPRMPRWTWFRDDAGWVQRPNDSCLLPPSLFELLEPDMRDLAMFDHSRTYPSRADAMTALSDACIRLATHQTA